MLIIDGVVDIAVYEGCSSFIYVDDDEDAIYALLSLYPLGTR